MKKVIAAIIISIITVLNASDFITAKVIDIEPETVPNTILYKPQIQNVKYEIVSGEYSGDTIEFQNRLIGHRNYDIILNKNDQVLLKLMIIDTDIINAELISKDKSNIILFGILLFLFTVLIIGGKKGIKGLLALTIIIIIIYFLLIPAILNGWNPIFITSLISIISIFITMTFLNGRSYKTFLSILICSISLIIIIVIGYLVFTFLNLSCIETEVSQRLLALFYNYSSNIKLDLSSIVFSSIIITILGNLMDISIDIVSPVMEFLKRNNENNAVSLFTIIKKVSHSILSAMIFTMIYALGVLLLPYLMVMNRLNFPLWVFFNYEFVTIIIFTITLAIFGYIINIYVGTVLIKIYIKRFRIYNVDI